MIQWSEINGRSYHVIGGRVSRAVTNPTFDPIAMPGAMYDYFRGNPDNRNPMEFLARRESIRPAYRDPAARIETLDAQGLVGCLLFPTLGMIYEEPLAHDPVAVCLCSGRSTAGWSRTGPSTTTIASSRPPTSRWPIRRGPWRS